MVLNSVFDKVSSLFFFCQSLTTLIWMFVSKMSMYINEMLPTVLVFIVSTCQVNKQFSFLGLTQKSNLKKVTSFLISVHVTAVWCLDIHLDVLLYVSVECILFVSSVIDQGSKYQMLFSSTHNRHVFHFQWSYLHVVLHKKWHLMIENWVALNSAVLWKHTLVLETRKGVCYM